MTIRPARRGASRTVLGWARRRILLLIAVVFGIVVMHTAGHALDGSSSAYPAPVPHTRVASTTPAAMPAAAPVPAALPRHEHAAEAARMAPAPAISPDGLSITAASPAAHQHNHLGCDLTSMCIGLLAGAAIALSLLRARLGGLPRGPTAAPFRTSVRTAAPAHPPSLNFLSVSRT